MDLSRGVGGLSPVSPGSDPQALSTANDQQSQQQESPDAGNKTLLDKIVQTYTKDAANRTSRIILTGQFSDSASLQALLQLHLSVQKSSQQHQSTLENSSADQSLDQSDDSQRCTGLLLCINSKNFVSLLESSTPRLISFLQSLLSSTSISASSIATMKIVSFTEESVREYPAFAHNCQLRQTVPIHHNQAQQQDEAQQLLLTRLSETECLALSLSIVTRLCEIGRDLCVLASSSTSAHGHQQHSVAQTSPAQQSPLQQNTSQQRIQDYISGIQSGAQSTNKSLLLQRIPTAEQLHQLCELDSDLLFGIADFLTVYEDPIDCVLEADLIHPPEQILPF